MKSRTWVNSKYKAANDFQVRKRTVRAKKLLSAIDKHGFDQSDFMINSKNVRMQYIVPSPVKFNTVNLSTSYGI